MIRTLFHKLPGDGQRRVRSPHGLVLFATVVIALACVSRSNGADGADTSARLTALQQQLNKLASRLDTLEKNVGGGSMSGSITNLDARLGALEAQVSGLQQSVDRPPTPPGTAADPQTFHVGPEIFARVQALENQLKHGVTAPFVVRDASGKSILQVDGDEDAGGILIGDAKAEHVSIGYSTGDGSVVALMDQKGTPIAGMVGGKVPAIGIDSGSHSVTLGTAVNTGASGNDQAFGLFVYKDNINVANMSIGTKGGILTLADRSGDITVDAGTSNNGRGIVRTGPSCCKPAGWFGPPQYLLGRE